VISILIDWISVTDTSGTLLSMNSDRILNSGAWVECKGKNGYTLGQKHSTGTREYINLDRPDMGVHIVYSGKSLARIKETMNITAEQVLIHHIKEGHSVARLDLAIDFKGYGTPVGEYIQAFQNGEVRTKLRKATIVKSLVGDGETLYIGSMKKRKNLIRVYDKGAELGTGEDWVRVELQIMGRKATSIGADIAESERIKETILGVIKSVVDFYTLDVWNQLTSDIDKVEMVSIPKEHGDTEKWLIKQVAPALAKVIVLNWEFWIQFKMVLEEHMPEVRKSEIDGEIEF